MNKSFPIRSMTLLLEASHCVYALVNHNTKRMQVMQSSQLLRSLQSLYVEINSPPWRELVAEMDNIEIIVLANNLSPDEKAVALGYYTKLYLDQGYKMYKEVDYPKWKVTTNIVMGSGIVSWAVYLVNQSRKKIQLGLFDHLDEANKFIETYYSGNLVRSLIVKEC